MKLGTGNQAMCGVRRKKNAPDRPRAFACRTHVRRMGAGSGCLFVAGGPGVQAGRSRASVLLGGGVGFPLRGGVWAE